MSLYTIDITKKVGGVKDKLPIRKAIGDDRRELGNCMLWMVLTISSKIIKDDISIYGGGMAIQKYKMHFLLMWRKYLLHGYQT